MSHQHLSINERQKIYELREKQKLSISAIAQILNQHKSEIADPVGCVGKSKTHHFNYWRSGVSNARSHIVNK